MDWNIQTFRRIALEEVLSIFLPPFFHSIFISINFFIFFIFGFTGCFSITKKIFKKRKEKFKFVI